MRKSKKWFNLKIYLKLRYKNTLSSHSINLCSLKKKSKMILSSYSKLKLIKFISIYFLVRIKKVKLYSIINNKCKIIKINYQRKMMSYIYRYIIYRGNVKVLLRKLIWLTRNKNIAPSRLIVCEIKNSINRPMKTHCLIRCTH